MSEVKKHDKDGDMWTVIHGNVVNVSEFVARHPGGKAVLSQYAGKVRAAAPAGPCLRVSRSLASLSCNGDVSVPVPVCAVPVRWLQVSSSGRDNN